MMKTAICAVSFAYYTLPKIFETKTRIIFSFSTHSIRFDYYFIYSIWKVSEKYSSKKGIWSYCSISKRMYSIYIPFFEPNQNLEQALSRIDYYRFYFVHLLEYYLNKKWYMHYKNEDNYAAHFAYLSAL